MALLPSMDGLAWDMGSGDERQGSDVHPGAGSFLSRGDRETLLFPGQLTASVPELRGRASGSWVSDAWSICTPEGGAASSAGLSV